MYYGNYNEAGEYLGFYTKKIHENIPSPSVELTEKEWREALSGDYKVILGSHTRFKESGINPELSLMMIRERRNQLLSESDWTQLVDSPLSPEKRAEWCQYRQMLRDMFEECNLHNLTCPTKPN